MKTLRGDSRTRMTLRRNGVSYWSNRVKLKATRPFANPISQSYRSNHRNRSPIVART